MKLKSTYKSHALSLAALLAAVQDGLADGDGVPVEEVVGAGDDVVLVQPASPAAEVLGCVDLLLGHG